MIDYFTQAPTARQSTLIDPLLPYWQQYCDSDDAQIAMQPLRIIVEVSGPIAGYHALNLDNLLARLVVDRATEGNALDNDHSPYLLPAPLKILWRHPQTGLPLYAANPFAPVGHNRQIILWWHKRFIKSEYAAIRPGVSKGDIQPNQGRFKEKRIPLPAQTASHWYADCIGDGDAISELLRLCHAIGKRRMAAVVAWWIVPMDEFAIDRPVPLNYLYSDDPATLPLNAQYCGWTPPYWPGVPECQGWCA